MLNLAYHKGWTPGGHFWLWGKLCCRCCFFLGKLWFVCSIYESLMGLVFIYCKDLAWDVTASTVRQFCISGCALVGGLIPGWSTCWSVLGQDTDAEVLQAAVKGWRTLTIRIIKYSDTILLHRFGFVLFLIELADETLRSKCFGGKRLSFHNWSCFSGRARRENEKLDWLGLGPSLLLLLDPPPPSSFGIPKARPCFIFSPRANYQEAG